MVFLNSMFEAAPVLSAAIMLTLSAVLGVVVMAALDAKLRTGESPFRLGRTLQITLHMQGGQKKVLERLVPIGPITETQTAALGEQLARRYNALTYELSWKN